MILRALPILLILAACAPQPMTPERALRLCEREARLADGVSGRIGVGVGSGGPVSNTSITLTNRIFNPVSEDDARSACLQRVLTGGPVRAPGTTAGVTFGTGG